MKRARRRSWRTATRSNLRRRYDGARRPLHRGMEWLEGSDLATIVAGDELPVTTVVDYVLQAWKRFAEVHARGIVHRDVKPSNLFVTRGADNRALVKLIDFGVSKIDVGGSNGRAAGGDRGHPLVHGSRADVRIGQADGSPRRRLGARRRPLRAAHASHAVRRREPRRNSLVHRAEGARPSVRICAPTSRAPWIG